MRETLPGEASTNLEELAMWLWYTIINKLQDWHWLHQWTRWRTVAGVWYRQCLHCGKVQTIDNTYDLD